jgi:hypothetical protein
VSPARAEQAVADETDAAQALRRPAPGPLWPWVKRASWLELAIFCALCFFWLAPGFDHQAMVFGWAHGIGFIALCLLIWLAILRHEAPYTLLAATLTPVGPLGSVIAIEVIERRQPSGEGGAKSEPAEDAAGQPNTEGAKTERGKDAGRAAKGVH